MRRRRTRFAHVTGNPSERRRHDPSDIHRDRTGRLPEYAPSSDGERRCELDHRGGAEFGRSWPATGERCRVVCDRQIVEPSTSLDVGGCCGARRVRPSWSRRRDILDT